MGTPPPRRPGGWRLPGPRQARWRTWAGPRLRPPTAAAAWSYRWHSVRHRPGYAAVPSAQPLGVLGGRVVGPGVDPALRVGAVRLLLVARGQVDHRSQATRRRV